MVEGTSPFEKRLVAIFPGWQAVRVRGDRYAVATDLRRAITWGNLLFGARSFAILEGPYELPLPRLPIILHSRVKDGRPRDALAALSAAFRNAVRE